MTCYSKELRTRKYVKGYFYLSFARNLSNKYGKQLLDTAAKTETDALKLLPKKLFINHLKQQVNLERNKIADKIVQPKPVSFSNLRDFEEIIIPTEKSETN